MALKAAFEVHDGASGEHHAITETDLDEDLFAYADPGDDEEQLSPGGALALSVIEALKRAAGE